jgi:hypothetical protein
VHATEIKCDAGLYTRLVCLFYKGRTIRDSAVGIAMGRGLTAGVRLPADAGDFSSFHSVQTGSGAHSGSYPNGTGGSFLGDKAAGA